MSSFVCSNCKSTVPLWESVDSKEISGAAKLANQYGMPLLCQIPLEPLVSNGNDKGVPVVHSHPNTATAKTFMDLAKSVNGLI